MAAVLHAQADAVSIKSRLDLSRFGLFARSGMINQYQLHLRRRYP